MAVSLLRNHMAPKPKQIVGTNIRPAALKRAGIAAKLINEPVIDFLSTASDARAFPILEKHNVKLPADARLIKS
jgi:hypothetical protein